MSSIKFIRPCTCRRLISTSNLNKQQKQQNVKSNKSSNIATTSKVKVEDFTTRKTPFQRLYPITQNNELPPLPTSKKELNLNNKKSFSKLTSLPLKLLKLSSKKEKDVLTVIPLIQKEEEEFPEYLPLIIRERNYLLSILRQNLYSSNPSPNLVWKSLVSVLSYPNILPNLPSSTVPLSILSNSTSTSNSTSSENDNSISIQDDSRRRIQLSLLELRRTFNILSKSRPYTKEGLNKLLVVVELLAQRSQNLNKRKFLPIESDTLTALEQGVVGTDGNTGSLLGSGRNDEVIKEIRGGGDGLRQQDWIALINFASFSYRSVRPTIEAESATLLFSQWSRTNSINNSPPKVSIEMYNTLLNVATEARAWDLFERIEDRMIREKIEEDDYTIGIKMKRDQFRAININAIWYRFINNLKRFEAHPKKNNDRLALWNSMIWVMIQRGLMEDGMRIYEAMLVGEVVSLDTLGPRDPFALITEEEEVIMNSNPYWIQPPQPSIATYQSLIQAFTHRGDLKLALRILKDMITTSSSSTSSTSQTLEPTPAIFKLFFKGFSGYGELINKSQQLNFDPLLLSGKKIRSNSLASTETFVPLLRRNRSTSTSSSSSSSNTTSKESKEDENPWTFKALQSLYVAFLNISPPPHPSSSSSSHDPLDSTTSTSAKHDRINKLRKEKKIPFEGERTGPTSQELFWLLQAFEKLTPYQYHYLTTPSSEEILFSNDENQEVVQYENRDEYILAIWERTENVFNNNFNPLTGKEFTLKERKKSGREGIWTGWRIDNRIRRKIEELRNRVERGRIWRREMGLLERKESETEMEMEVEKKRGEEKEDRVRNSE